MTKTKKTGIYKPFDYDTGVYMEDSPWFGKKCRVVGERFGRLVIAFYCDGKRYTDFFEVEKEEVSFG